MSTPYRTTQTRLTMKAAAVVGAAFATACAMGPNATHLSPLGTRLSDESIQRDLSRFDSLSAAARTRSPSVHEGARREMYVQLARDAYDRNASPSFVELLLNESKTSSAAIPRTRNPALWALLDSAQTASARDSASKTLAQSTILLENALLRAQSPLLGAPSCEKWDADAVRIADDVRRELAADEKRRLAAARSPEASSSSPATPPVAPTRAASTPNELRGVPSAVHFALDRATLAPASRRVLNALVDSLKKFPEVQITLEGHTDSRASSAYNAALSRRRAAAVRRFLVSAGVDAARLHAQAFGKSRLESTDKQLRDHAVNRRVLLRYFAPSGTEISAVLQLDDLQLEKRIR